MTVERCYLDHFQWDFMNHRKHWLPIIIHLILQAIVTFRTGVTGWGTSKTLHMITKRVKAKRSLGVWNVAVGVKHAATHWFYQNDWRTKGLDPKNKGGVGDTEQGGNKMFRKCIQFRFCVDSLKTPNQLSRANTTPLLYIASWLTDSSQLRENITGAPNSSLWPVTQKSLLTTGPWGISDFCSWHHHILNLLNCLDYV